jgi:ABC-2 type transport system ATP-binding protein
MICVKNLNKSFSENFFKKKQVLHNVSFDIPNGSIAGFVGGNGQGKTTTIKCLMQFIFSDSGEIKIFEQTLASVNKNLIGYLPERPYLYDFLTSRQFLQFHWSLVGADPRLFDQQCKKILSLVELSYAADQKIRTYSKGMMQRLGLAQALLHEPKLLILDEPMSGLDPDGRSLVKEILKKQSEKGVTIFFSSHLLQDMDELCDHLVVIDQGHVNFSGKPSDFRLQYPDLEAAFRAFKKERA